jgi:hypothetical protein
VVLCFIVFLCASPSSELVVFDPGKWRYRTRSEGLTGYSCLSVLLPLRVRLGHLSWNNSGGSATNTLSLPFIFRLHRLFFGVSALTFRCKPPLGASSPFISAVSAFIFRCKPPLGASLPFISVVSAFIFRCKLCIPFGTTFEQKTYAAFP